MLVLVFAMVCGAYIFSVCAKQINGQTSTKSLNVEVNWSHCHDHDIDRSRIPYLHYPKPTTFSRAECACNPVRLFAILSMQRSGSGWFETLLNSHTNLSSNGEILSAYERRNNVSSILSTLDRVYNLDWFTSASKNHCSAAVGFKWMLNQGVMEYHKEIVEYFNDRGVSVIFLFRRNLLRRMVSVLANSYDRYAKLLNGTHKSHVHSYEEADTLSRYRPVINSTSLVMDLMLMEKMVLEVLEYFSSTRHIILYYEDLVKNRTKLVDVQQFLGLPLMELTSQQVKIHRGSLSEHIENWDDVKLALIGTAYQTFLHTDYN
ncbi:nodulation protein h [Phtheirospermum japonicum]|uniref:Sulfotransferase n=1 Tax=Phtheirospermum japonicum TaxID=374723 RepID=A0A830CBD6_9LAMI|nr:nodulation protein h [Phtheirospermum japonicum]